MGGRGSRSGISKYKYGENYNLLFQYNNIKFVSDNKKTSTSSPIESMTKHRVYVSVDKNNDLRTVSFMDKEGNRFKRIDLKGNAHFQSGEKIATPHVQFGKEKAYFTRKLNKKEKRLIYKINKVWRDFNNGD